MAQTYTVKSGDNLSTIAKNYGTTVGAISGYRSGNPSLIYPGEVLTIGAGSAPAGGGGGGGDSGLPGAPDYTFDPNKFAGEATSQVAPIYDPQITGLQKSLPLLQQRYDLLLEQITAQSEGSKAQLGENRTTNLGQVTASAEARGLRGGQVQSQKLGVENVFNKALTAITSDTSLQLRGAGVERESKVLELDTLISKLVGEKGAKITEVARTLALDDLDRRQKAFENLLALSNEKHNREMQAIQQRQDQQRIGIEQQRLALAVKEAARNEPITSKQKGILGEYASLLDTLTIPKGKTYQQRVGEEVKAYSAAYPDLAEYFIDIGNTAKAYSLDKTKASSSGGITIDDKGNLVIK